MEKTDPLTLNRRDLLKLGGGLIVASTASLRTNSVEAFGGQITNTACAGQGYIEVHPTSPLILEPFRDPLPIPTPLAPCSLSEMMANHPAPGPGAGQQDSWGGTHQIWPSKLG